MKGREKGWRMGLRICFIPRIEREKFSESGGVEGLTGVNILDCFKQAVDDSNRKGNPHILLHLDEASAIYS